MFKKIEKTRVFINGRSGRMGKAILEAMQNAGFKNICEDCTSISDAQLVLDFSSADAQQSLQESVLPGQAVLIGTTGLSDQTLQTWQNLAVKKNLKFAHYPNTSMGINLISKALADMQIPANLFQISIEETHHIHKKDAPSGTANQLAKIINFPAEKITSHRIGEIIGEHSIKLSNPLEEIIITHRVVNRSVFAVGALRLGLELLPN